MTKILKSPARIEWAPDKEPTKRRKQGGKYMNSDIGYAFVFSERGDLKDFRSKLKGKDLF